mgnify:CR=1 FL=1
MLRWNIKQDHKFDYFKDRATDLVPQLTVKNIDNDEVTIGIFKQSEIHMLKNCDYQNVSGASKEITIESNSYIKIDNLLMANLSLTKIVVTVKTKDGYLGEVK